MRLDAEEHDDARSEHDEERDERDLGAAVEAVGEPAADRADAGTDERSEECGHREGDFQEFFRDEQAECGGEADEGAEAAGVDPAHEPGVLVTEDREHALRALLRQRQIVHEHPDEHERQGCRHSPEVADVLDVHHAAWRGDAGAKERGEVPAEQQRRRQVDQRDAEIADAGVDAERKAFMRLREEEADVGHRGGEVGAGDADEGDEQDECVVRRRRVLQCAAEAEEREEQQGRRDEGRIAAADEARQVRVEEAARRADETRQCSEREELFIGEVEAGHVELGGDRRPERPDDKGEHKGPC